MKYLLPVVTRLMALLWAVTLVAGGCLRDGDHRDGIGPTVPTAPPTSPVTTVPDVATVPANIDEAYLNEVLKALNRVDGDATRLIVASEELPRPAVERLQAIYRGEELQRQLELWLEQIPKGFDGFVKPPGDKINEVRRIMSASADCVYIETAEDASHVATKATSIVTIFIGLEVKASDEDHKRLNPTAWMITYAGTSPEQTDPGLNPCVS